MQRLLSNRTHFIRLIKLLLHVLHNRKNIHILPFTYSLHTLTQTPRNDRVGTLHHARLALRDPTLLATACSTNLASLRGHRGDPECLLLEGEDKEEEEEEED